MLERKVSPSRSRIVTDLIWARLSAPPPGREKPTKLYGTRAKGMTYERLVARRLRHRVESGEIAGTFFGGQWIAFSDRNGKGYCQPDIFIVTPTIIWLLEAKLTQTDFANPQLSHLYYPVLKHIFKQPIALIQVCKGLRRHPGKVLINDFTEAKPDGRVWVWHYIG